MSETRARDLANVGVDATQLVTDADLPTPSVAGLVPIAPTSVNIQGDGSLSGYTTTFTNALSVSFNGVFSAEYANYMIVMSGTRGMTGTITCRLRASGTDDLGSVYLTQSLYADGTTVAASRLTGGGWELCRWDDDLSAATVTMYSPFTATRTVFDSSNAYSFADATFRHHVGSHKNATSFDGFTLLTPGMDFSGSVTVYGYHP